MGLSGLLRRSLSNRRARRRAKALARSQSKCCPQRMAHRGADDAIRLDALEPRILLSASVFTDKPDYAPGETAIITGTGYQLGEVVELQVEHVIAPGQDGEFGTADDILGDNTGSGHQPWYVTDGVRTAGDDGILGNDDDEGDLDGAEDGNIQTEWFVNPDDSLNETFRLTATGQTSGEVARHVFTDAGGAYTLNFAAADPSIYIPPIPFPAALTAPTGRGDGDPLIPLAEFNDGMSDVRVESLPLRIWLWGKSSHSKPRSQLVVMSHLKMA